MNKNIQTPLRNLTEFAMEVEELFINKFGAKPSLAIAFALPPYMTVHWVTNVSRADGIDLFRKTAAKMAAQTN